MVVWKIFQWLCAIKCTRFNYSLPEISSLYREKCLPTSFLLGHVMDSSKCICMFVSRKENKPIWYMHNQFLIEILIRCERKPELRNAQMQPRVFLQRKCNCYEKGVCHPWHALMHAQWSIFKQRNHAFLRPIFSATA